MSFIEGIGDEVTAFAVVLLVLILSAVVTFLLNSTPFAENREISQNVPNDPSLINENDVQHSINEESRQNRDDNTMNSSDNYSDINHCEEHGDSINESESMNINSDENTSEDIMHSHIYPEISDSDTPSVPASEEISVETEEISPMEQEGIQIRLKYLDDTERTVLSQPTIKIGDFKRTHFTEDLHNNKTVRLIFSGQVLQDNFTLQSYGVTNNCVIHVQILQAQMQQNSLSVSQNVDLDLSHLLWPLLSVILGICWILYFKYPEFFNVMSLGILFLFTGSFVYFYSQVQHQ